MYGFEVETWLLVRVVVLIRLVVDPVEYDVDARLFIAMILTCARFHPTSGQ